MSIGPQIMGRSAEAYKKIRNTARYLLSNLSDFDPARDAVPYADLAFVEGLIGGDGGVFASESARSDGCARMIAGCVASFTIGTKARIGSTALGPSVTGSVTSGKPTIASV